MISSYVGCQAHIGREKCLSVVMDCTKISIPENTNEVILRGYLERLQCLQFKAKIALDIPCDLPNHQLKR